MANNNQSTVTWPQVAIALAFPLVLLTILWLLFRPQIAQVYYNIRSFETLGLWRWTGWGRYFGDGGQGPYEIWSIYVSSLPFGVVCAVLIGLIGAIVSRRAHTRHIINFLRPDPDAKRAMEWTKLMKRLAPYYPHNEFFLLFPMYRYSVSDQKGPASQPMSALELLVDSGSLIFEDESAAPAAPPRKDAKPGERVVDRGRIKERLIAPFGPRNPFLGVSLRNEKEVAEAVASLPWYGAIILYSALRRINALHDAAAELKTEVDGAEEFMRGVWREINAEKKKPALADRLVLGPFDYPDPLKKGKKGTKKGFLSKRKSSGETPVSGFNETPPNMVTLTDHLAEVGPGFKATKTAREGLIKIITKPALGINPKKPVDVIDCILQYHGYVFGVLASSLTDGSNNTLPAARTTGVMAPNTFLWLRFVDRSLWRFLNYVGMQTPCPEASGMFDHWQMELVLKSARSRPEIADTTITSIIQEARKQGKDALAARDMDELMKRMREQTDALSAITKASEAWNDDAKPAPNLGASPH